MVINEDTTKFLTETLPPNSGLLLQPGDLLVQRANSLQYLGASAIYNGPPSAYAYPDLMMRIRIGEPALRCFTWRWLNSQECREYFRSKATGTAGNMPKINGTTLREAPLPLPPLPEQRRIVAKLDELRARSRKAREALDEVPALLDKLKQSVLAAAFRGDLTAEWRAAQPPGSVEPASVLLDRIWAERQKRWEQANPKKKYVEPEPVDTAGLPELPEGWCWASIEQVTSHIVDCLHRTPVYVEGDGFPAIRTADVVPGRLLLTQARRVDAATYREQVQRLRPEPGDVLYTREGERYGLAACVPEGVTLCMSQRMMQFRVERPVVPQFFMWALNSPVGYGQASADVGGSTSPHVNIRSIRRFAIPIASLSEQAVIASCVERVFELMRRLEKSTITHSGDLTSLDQSLLAKAFRGELVPQDPNDEPADQLLARIKAEAAGASEARRAQSRASRRST